MSEKSDRAKREEKVLEFWQDNKIFEKSLEKKAPKGEFVFYEGPPTANAKPALHHLEARAFKDAIPRYKTMRGYRVPRKAGWDTHGLPVELQIEKKLGLTSKKEIEKHGVEQFNKECKQSVFEYIDEWEKFTERIGYWVNFDEAYYTFDADYMEAVWSIVAEVEKRGLVYKDYKVVPWCPRCGTALSSHELAQGYQDVKDLSVYAKFKIVVFPNAYFLAWTTTPWTLPGNVALAVGEDVDYVEAKVGEEIYVLAKDRLSIITEPYEILAEHKGKEMAGMSYEPLYPFLPPHDKAHKIYTADFVNTEDGTGIVHTAVMYGQDDFELGTKAGLPKYHLVDESGHFKPEAGFLAGRFVRDEETAVEVIKDLAHRGFLFKKEKYEHSYPHCWRCKTALIYYARDSWYIAMSKLRDELVRENEKINWEPEHIRDGRFGEWLREIKDWAISRERYWGTPLPIWESKSGKRIVVDSIDTLKKYTKKSDNTFFFVRHGEADHNVLDICSSDPTNPHHITEVGRQHVIETAKKLKDKGVDIIIRSPFVRAKETAELLADQIGYPNENIAIDERIGEYKFGDFNMKPWEEYSAFRKGHEFDMNFAIPNGESLQDAKNRFGNFLLEIDKKYSGKNIVVVTHGIGFQVAPAVAEFANESRSVELIRKTFRKVPDGSFDEITLVNLPHNDNFELDLHKPYIDEVVLEKDGEEYRRVKEVMDVWFDSGAMPFAQDPQSVLYPADFISEAIDQTRGWFYTLHAIGVLMGKGRAYKNVICLGHLLDKDGKKMSKSIGNIVDPWEMMDKYGIDALRLWMYSINQPGESKNFDERSVDEINKRVFNMIDNVHAFYELYRDRSLESREFKLTNPHILDSWILMRLDELTDKMTESLDAYKLLEPVRALRGFVDDLSTWYLRRSRDRIKDGDEEAKRTLYFVLKRVAKLLAPFAPFVAEDLYQKLRVESEPESVHLCDWPEVNKSIFDMFKRKSDVLEKMSQTRKVVSLVLDERQKANIKVRQPLGRLTVRSLWLTAGYIELIKDEVNVKEVVANSDLETEVRLDTVITPELEEEGRVRDAIRAIQDWRKEEGLTPGEKVEYKTSDELFFAHKEEIEKATNVELSHL